jgi:hypothetical protein
MAIPIELPCDGCGQLATTEHIARRLQRLEWSTRFRPLHIQAVLLASISPEINSDFLYFTESSFTGQAAELLRALSIPTESRSSEDVLIDFQKRGLLLSYVLECPVDPGVPPAEFPVLVENHLPQTVARIRRSLKPKRVLLLSSELQAVLPVLSEAALACPVIATPLAAFSSLQTSDPSQIDAFLSALPTLAAQGS